jgi:hypothetical protein
VQRLRPNARFKVEILASIPALKLRNFLYTQELFAISRTDKPLFLAKTTSFTLSSLASARLSFEDQEGSGLNI